MTTLDELQSAMAHVIQSETGAVVAVTFFAEDQFSICAESADAVAKAHTIMARVPGVELDSSFADADDSYFGNYYRHPKA